MLFVLSAASKFHAKPFTDVAVRSVPRLAGKAKVLAGELRNLQAKDLKKQLHVNDALAKEYESFLSNFEKQTPVPACCLYDSAIFDGLDLANLDEDDAQWANRHVRIYSGLYGLVRPFDLLQPLSLPVTLGTKLANSKGKFLRDYWREGVTKELYDGLERLPMPVMVDCSSKEDGDVFDEDNLPDGTTITNIEFNIADKRAKGEAMGEFVRWALETRCQIVGELLEFRGLVEEDDTATFRVSPKSKDKDTITFEENLGEGAGGWRKKVMDSGLTRGGFEKEFLKGKNKYLRSDYKKAMSKDKRVKSKVAVY
eukprot:TRINITY_DN49446_c0_g1_i1.p1 TRINITY_DN49446_c0_g1~~TRINITY_DN49446_c0_g1_i1.p1  ORF type:complete len:311 (-),score=66.75 TRINITY_DN49446_c0_g1_i1:83-1015(-)